MPSFPFPPFSVSPKKKKRERSRESQCRRQTKKLPEREREREREGEREREREREKEGGPTNIGNQSNIGQKRRRQKSGHSQGPTKSISQLLLLITSIHFAQSLFILSDKKLLCHPVHHVRGSLWCQRNSLFFAIL